MSLLQMSDYKIGSLTSQLFFWINCLWHLCFVPKGMASAGSISEAGAFGVLPQEVSKCITEAKAWWRTVLSETRHTGQCHICTLLPLILGELVAWCPLSDVPSFEDGYFPRTCKHQKPIPPQRGENESSEDPKKKLPISHLIPTALSTLHVFSAWCYALAKHKRFPV